MKLVPGHRGTAADIGHSHTYSEIPQSLLKLYRRLPVFLLGMTSGRTGSPLEQAYRRKYIFFFRFFLLRLDLLLNRSLPGLDSRLCLLTPGLQLFLQSLCLCFNHLASGGHNTLFLLGNNKITAGQGFNHLSRILLLQRRCRIVCSCLHRRFSCLRHVNLLRLEQIQSLCRTLSRLPVGKYISRLLKPSDSVCRKALRRRLCHFPVHIKGNRIILIPIFRRKGNTACKHICSRWNRLVFLCVKRTKIRLFFRTFCQGGISAANAIRICCRRILPEILLRLRKAQRFLLKVLISACVGRQVCGA